VLPQLQIGTLKEMTWISKKRSGAIAATALPNM